VSSVELESLGFSAADLVTGDDEATTEKAIFMGCILYASVHSAGRASFIQQIISLEQDTQQQLMGTIQIITRALVEVAPVSDDDEEPHTGEAVGVSELKAQLRDLNLRNVSVNTRRRTPSLLADTPSLLADTPSLLADTTTCITGGSSRDQPAPTSQAG
jgi:hypothetical protein